MDEGGIAGPQYFVYSWFQGRPIVVVWSRPQGISHGAHTVAHV